MATFPNLINIFVRIFCLCIYIANTSCSTNFCEIPLHELKYLNLALDYMPPVQKLLDKTRRESSFEMETKRECEMQEEKLKTTLNAIPDAVDLISNVSRTLIGRSFCELQEVLQKDFWALEDQRNEKKSVFIKETKCDNTVTQPSYVVCELDEPTRTAKMFHIDHKLLETLRNVYNVSFDDPVLFKCDNILEILRKYIMTLLISFREAPKHHLQHFLQNFIQSDEREQEEKTVLLLEYQSRITEKSYNDDIEMMSQFLDCRDFKMAGFFFHLSRTFDSIENIFEKLLEKQNYKLINILKFSRSILPGHNGSPIFYNEIVKYLEFNVNSPERLVVHYFQKTQGWAATKFPELIYLVDGFLFNMSGEFSKSGKLPKKFNDFFKTNLVLMEDYIGRLVRFVYNIQGYDTAVNLINQNYMTDKLKTIGYKHLQNELEVEVDLNYINLEKIGHELWLLRRNKVPGYN